MIDKSVLGLRMERKTFFAEEHDRASCFAKQSCNSELYTFSFVAIFLQLMQLKSAMCALITPRSESMSHDLEWLLTRAKLFVMSAF